MAEGVGAVGIDAAVVQVAGALVDVGAGVAIAGKAGAACAGEPTLGVDAVRIPAAVIHLIGALVDIRAGGAVALKP